MGMGASIEVDERRTLFHQGDDGESVYLLLSGLVKVVRGDAAGRSTILTLRGAGDVVGDLAAIDGQPRSATVTTLTATRCRVVPGALFRAFSERPGVGSAITRYIAYRLRDADTQRAEMATLPVRQRLARALLRTHAGAGAAVALPQQELANLIGASRNSVVDALAVLRRRAIIATERRGVVIRDLDALHALANEDLR
ncbi:Crp/Fnr family transcriptional regulator [Pilimelia columellifera subsp. columellifera]|uniref:Crp/Fnr family transcriptional regulator n=2 Tax=Pilimelia TaxID=53370 RepID=A0ABN3N5M2_9ACTN